MKGKKLYLRKKRPAGEKVIILKEDVSDLNPPLLLSESDQKTASEEEGDNPVKTRMVEMTNQQPFSSNQKNPNEEKAGDEKSAIREVKTRWISHTVSSGESLWEISQKYGTKVEIIKMINKLNNDDISEGMRLKILAKEDLVGK